MSELLSTPKQHVTRTPKKFLKKGEGLKRFAAYKPPLPKVTAKKIRQTIVKFDLKNNYSEEKSCYLPDILLDDSKNLSMEVPPIPPPKIVHTPMRPTRVQQTPMRPTRVQQTPMKQSRNIQRTPIKPPPKILNTPVREVPVNHLDQNINNNNNNNKDNNNTKENSNLNNNNNNTKKNGKSGKRYNLRSRRQDDPVIEQRVTSDLSSPLPGNCILALAKQVQQVESTLNELKVKIFNCNCGSEPVRTTRRGPAPKKENQLRHPAPAAVSTPKILRSLADDVSQLKKSFDDLQVAR